MQKSVLNVGENDYRFLNQSIAVIARLALTVLDSLQRSICVSSVYYLCAVSVLSGYCPVRCPPRVNYQSQIPCMCK